MKILTQWDTTSLHSAKEFESLHSSPASDIKAILPPILSDFENVMQKREQHVQQNIDREKCSESLFQSHENRNAPASTLHHIRQLAHPNTFLIIAGQQPGILGGPLYTFFKILHAIVLSRKLSESSNYTFSPAFWNASEDHDFDEISTCFWQSKEGKLDTFVWERENSAQPFYWIAADEFPLEEFLDWIKAISRTTDFSDEIYQDITSCMAKATSFPDFTETLLWQIFEKEGLIIVRPDDPYTQQQAKPLFEREIKNPQESSQCVSRIGETLDREGMKVQLHKRKDRTSFFLVRENRRIPIYIKEDGFIDDGQNRFTTSELLDLLEKQPDCFSASAILRPVIQDSVYPTAGMILGPGETAYHLLLHDLYSTHGIPRTMLVPRFGFTFIENRDMRLLQKYDLSPIDLRQDFAALTKSLLRKEKVENIEPEKESLDNSLDKFYHSLKQRAEKADPTILKVLDKNRGKIEQQIEQSENLVLRREAEKDETVRKHITNLQTSLFPDGELQERRYTIFNYLIKYGYGFVDEMKDICENIEKGNHYFIQIP